MLAVEVVDPHYVDVLDVRFQQGWIAGSPKGGCHNDAIGIAELTGEGEHPVIEFPLLLQCLACIERFSCKRSEVFFFQNDLGNLEGLFPLYCLYNASGKLQRAGGCAVYAGVYK